MQPIIDIIREVVSRDVGYVDRGPLAGPDFTKIDLTLDSTWQTLDLSAIVPEPAKCVVLEFILNAPPVPPSYGFVSPSFHAGQRNLTYLVAQIPNRICPFQVTVSLDSNRTIHYKFDNVAWIGVNVWVQAWWLHRTDF